MRSPRNTESGRHTHSWLPRSPVRCARKIRTWRPYLWHPTSHRSERREEKHLRHHLQPPNNVLIGRCVKKRPPVMEDWPDESQQRLHAGPVGGNGRERLVTHQPFLHMAGLALVGLSLSVNSISSANKKWWRWGTIYGLLEDLICSGPLHYARVLIWDLTNLIKYYFIVSNICWLPYSRKYWWGIKFGGLAVSEAKYQIKIRQYIVHWLRRPREQCFRLGAKLRNSEHAAEIFLGTWPTTMKFAITATAYASAGLSGSLS